MKTKARLLAIAILIAIAVVLFPGCASDNTATPSIPGTIGTKEKLKETGVLIAKKAGQAALEAVLQYAINQQDAQMKGDYVQGLSVAMRSQIGNLVSADTVRELATIWTPEKPHWENLAGELAGIYAKANPQTPKEAAMVLEAIAKGLEDQSK